MDTDPVTGKKRQGFALLSPERRKELAAKGGRISHAKGRAYEWDSESAKMAGHKGGKVSRGGRRAAIEDQDQRRSEAYEK